MNTRQQSILTAVIEEYIDSALPVGSQLIAEKYGFDLSPATIRSEMIDLSREGFLFQPHTSAGRIPTGKAYRFFVDFLIDDKSFDSREEMKIRREFKKMKKMSDKILRSAVKFLSLKSNNFAAAILDDFEECYKAGAARLFEEPEFQDSGRTSNILKILDDFEDYAREFKESFFAEPSFKIYIGKENPISKMSDLAMIVGEYNDGFLTIIGPQRMDYNRNISLIKLVREMLSE